MSPLDAVTHRVERVVFNVALEHASRGWPVFPVNGKVPRIKGWPDFATTDASQIRSWWRQWPSANVGLLCGVHFWALDIDPESGGDDRLVELQATHGALPLTVEAITGRSLGCHLLFAHDARVGTGSICPGLDFRGARGFIVAPGSIHPTTRRRYEWDALSHPDDTPIAVAPPWLVDLVAGREAFTSTPTGAVASSWLAIAFRHAGWLGDAIDGNRVCVRCPNAAQHSDGRGIGRDGSSVILAPTSRSPLGAFACKHGHCADVTTERIVTQLLPFDAGRDATAQHPLLVGYLSSLFKRAREREQQRNVTRP